MSTPLPLTHGALLVDNSALEHLECPYMFYLSFVRRKQSLARRAGLNFGSAMHLYWKVRYRGHAPLAEQKRNALLAEFFRRNPQPEGEWRTLELAQTAASVYEDCYNGRDYTPLRTRGMPRVEQSFLFYLTEIDSTPIYYDGRIDYQVEHENAPWPVDHKTALQYGNTFTLQQAVSAQLRGYCWAFRQAYGEWPRGYGINAFRTRPPRKKDEYDPTLGVRPDDFERDWHYITPDEIEEWRENLIHQLELVFYMARNGWWPKIRSRCIGKYGPCEFYDACTLHGEMHEQALTSNLYVDSTWSPLNKPNQIERIKA